MICALCEEENELSNSHIIPEFVYKYGELYDEKHRYHVVSTNPEKNNRYEQKGLREPLLCKNCESEFSSYETYAKEALFDKIDVAKIDKNTGRIVFKNIDYHKFKLFQLSVLWRASVSKLEMFQEIDLNVHEKKIQKLLRDANPGAPYEYGCIFKAIVAEDENFEAAKIIAQPNQLSKFDGHRMFVFLMAGLFWVYIVSSHTQTFLHKEFFLQENGTLIISTKGVNAEKVFRNFAETIYKQGKLDY